MEFVDHFSEFNWPKDTGLLAPVKGHECGQHNRSRCFHIWREVNGEALKQNHFGIGEQPV